MALIADSQIEGVNIKISPTAVNVVMTTDIEGANFVTLYAITVCAGPQNTTPGVVWFQIWRGPGGEPEANLGSWFRADCKLQGTTEIVFPGGLKLTAAQDLIVKAKSSNSHGLNFYSFNANYRINT